MLRMTECLYASASRETAGNFSKWLIASMRGRFETLVFRMFFVELIGKSIVVITRTCCFNNKRYGRASNCLIDARVLNNRTAHPFTALAIMFSCPLKQTEMTELTDCVHYIAESFCLCTCQFWGKQNRVIADRKVGRFLVHGVYCRQCRIGLHTVRCICCIQKSNSKVFLCHPTSHW